MKQHSLKFLLTKMVNENTFEPFLSLTPIKVNEWNLTFEKFGEESKMSFTPETQTFIDELREKDLIVDYTEMMKLPTLRNENLDTIQQAADIITAAVRKLQKVK
jgi:hypothetical protein